MTESKDPPLITAESPELTEEEYNNTYGSGSGGHELPAEVLALLNDEEPKDG